MQCKKCGNYLRLFKDGMDNVCGLNLEKVVNDDSSCEKFSI